MKIIEETHMHGVLSVEQDLPLGGTLCDVGIQTAGDGRIWIWIDGEPFLQFKPFLCEEKLQEEEEGK